MKFVQTWVSAISQRKSDHLTFLIKRICSVCVDCNYSTTASATTTCTRKSGLAYNAGEHLTGSSNHFLRGPSDLTAMFHIKPVIVDHRAEWLHNPWPAANAIPE
jgi:hypothetical protein